MYAIIEYFVSRNIFVNLLTVLLIAVGGYTALTMNREAFPNINFDIVVVTGIYPGASPHEVEKLVTNPLEEAIKEVDGIKEYRSSSLENRSGIVITIDPDVLDTQKVIDDIRAAVDRTEDLPDDVDSPIVTEITTARSPVIEIALGREKKNGKYLLSERELRDQAEILEDKLLELDGVARITKNGWKEREIHVKLNPDLLTRNYVSIQQVIDALQRRNINLPGGDIKSGNKEIIVRTVGEYQNIREIENTFVRSNEVGSGIKIKDIGKVENGFEDIDYIDRVEGHPAISLVVVKRETADIISLVGEVMNIVEGYKATMPEGVVISEVNDISYFIKRRLGILQSNGFFGLVFVIASLFFFMGWRTSLMVALGIPVAIGGTFIFMQYFGVTLNLISMFGLILVIGIIVDDAIIVSENFYRYLEEGYSTYDAAVRGTKEVVAPIIATISTSIAAFAPLMFMTGIFGKFIFTIPLVIIIALLASLFESFFILPSHLHDANKYVSEDSGEIKGESTWFKRFRDTKYIPTLRWALRHKYITVSLLTVSFIFAIVLQVLFGRFTLFPDAIETFHVKMTAPRGSNKEYTAQFVEAVEREVARLPGSELDTFTSRIGIIQKNVNDPGTKRGSNYGQLLVYLTPEQDRSVIGGVIGTVVRSIRQLISGITGIQLPPPGRDAQEIISDLRGRVEWLLNDKALQRLRKNQNAISGDKEVQNIAKEYDIPPEFAHLKGKLESLEFEKLKGGPPVGKPVAIEITGDEFETLEEIAGKYKEVMSNIDGIVDIDDDFESGKEEVRLRINEALASQAGVSVAQAAIAVNAAINGAVATSIKRADEEVDIRVQFDDRFRESTSAVNDVSVMNMRGNLIPVGKMIRSEPGEGLVAINHLDGKRLLTVTSNLVETKLGAAKAASLIQDKSAHILKDYPGYSIRFGGENKDTQESMMSLGRAFFVGFVIIFMILASLFKSLLQPLVVMGAIPFSLMGVILAFLLNGWMLEGLPIPLSFMSMMGIIGLAGVVVNDSIILVDFANSIRQENPDLSSEEVAEKAGGMRLRAVMLTTITTVLGLLPTAYGIGGDDPFLRPMALAFSWGLLFSTLLTLVIIPVQYSILVDMTTYIKRKLKLIEH